MRQAKIPKLKAGGGKAAVEAIRVFGGGTFDLKALTAPLPELMDHRDKDVREQGAALFVELRRARGDGPLFAQLKAQKVTEDRIKTMKETPLPERAAESAESALSLSAKGQRGCTHALAHRGGARAACPPWTPRPRPRLVI